MSTQLYCNHVWVERYYTDHDKASLKVFCECSLCNLKGETFAIKVSNTELSIKRARALHSARQLSFQAASPGPVKARA